MIPASMVSFVPSPKRLFHPPNPSVPANPKKTRHLPNLSDCHSCRRHVTSSSSSTTTTTPLPSLWRIVLLCGPCTARIRSANSCSYCFREADAKDSFRCPECRRRVHRQCVVRYGSSPPWSFCTDFGSDELGFGVCVDCWVPKSLAVSDRVYRNRVQSNGGREGKIIEVESGRVCESRRSEAEIRVSNKIVACKKRKDLKLCSEGEVRVSSDGGREKNKIAGAARGKEKVVAAKRALEYLDGTMKMAKNKREGERKECLTRCGINGSDIDDAVLAIRLHRAMNSSPRISRRFTLGSSSGLGVANMKVDNRDSSIRPLEPKGRFNFTYKRRGSDSKLSDNVDVTGSERSVSVTSTEEGNSKDELLVYRRKCKTCEDCEVKEVVSESKLSDNVNVTGSECSVSVTSTEEGNSKHELLVYRRKCKTCEDCEVREVVSESNSSMVFEKQNFHMQDLLVYRRKGKQCIECLSKYELIPDDGMVLGNQNSPAQDLLVYKRKCKTFDGQVKDEGIPENGMINENQSCHTQGVLVYRRKRNKDDESQESAEGVPENSTMYFANQSCRTNDKLENKLSFDIDKLENKLSFDSDTTQGHLQCNGICNVKLENSDSTY